MRFLSPDPHAMPEDGIADTVSVYSGPEWLHARMQPSWLENASAPKRRQRGSSAQQGDRTTTILHRLSMLAICIWTRPASCRAE